MSKPLLRQLMVAISTELGAFSIGGALSFPSVLIEQLQLNNNMDVATRSWIGSIYGLAGIPAIFMPWIAQKYGRKCGFLLACTCSCLGWLLALLANNTAFIFASESFHGFAMNCLIQVSCESITEILSPNYRMFFLQLISFLLITGMVTGGIVGRFYHYKTVSLIMFIAALMSLVIAMFWRESPQWYAWKGDIEKCKNNFIWFRGDDDSSKKELLELISRENSINKETLWKRILRRDFYMPIFHIFMLMNLMYWSGGDVITIYFMDMIKQLTQNDKAAFYSNIAMYSILITGGMITNFSTTRFKNKSVLLFSAAGISVCLFCAFIVSLLQSIGVISNDSLICMYILILYIVFYSLGMNGFVFLIGSELMPVKHRHIGGSVLIISNCVLYASTQKISPYLMHYLGMWSTFLIFCFNVIFCGWFVWKYIPETKGRTLKEIEEFYVFGNFVTRNNIDDELVELNDVKKVNSC